jgi:LmbE family N-acetylglucosaminyl deacetylase/fructoselysine-6-P-deglycase FrlB-like protein
MCSAFADVTYRCPETGRLQSQVKLSEAFGPGPWVIVSPHDDDVVLGMGMLTAAAREQNIDVHVVVVSDGRMGYADPAEKETIVETRKSELLSALSQLEIPKDHVYFLGLPDGALVLHEGCNREGTGLGQRLTAILRKIQSTVVFGPTPRDLHPDHRVTSRELDMACCWAGSDIWREMGPVLLPVKRFNYAVYCAFPDPPEFQISSGPELFNKKLAALSAFKSQTCITDMVDRLKSDGPVEYIHEAHWEPYQPSAYADLFVEEIADDFGAGYRADCMAVTLLLAHWKPQAWPALTAALEAAQEHPLLLVAEGSSRLFPSQFLSHLLRHFGHHARIDSTGGRQARDLIAHATHTLLISNSGETRELIDLVQEAPESVQILGLLGQANSKLANLIPDAAILSHPTESVVPATTSVFAQCLTLGHCAAQICGHEIPMLSLRSAITAVLSEPLPEQFHHGIANVQRLWWADGGDGVAAELALKTMEVTGLPGHGNSGNLLIHGIEESLGPHDMVVWYNPPEQDRKRIKEMTDKTGAKVMLIGDDTCDWDVPDIGIWSPLVHLVTGWRMLDEMAKIVGHNPDHPKRIKKVGNPA